MEQRSPLADNAAQRTMVGLEKDKEKADDAQEQGEAAPKANPKEKAHAKAPDS